MKFLAFFALLFVSAQAAMDPKLVGELMEKITKFAEECLVETKATSDDIATYMAHKIPESHEGKCLLSCVYKKFKVQNEDGSMNPDQILAMIEKVKPSDPDLYEKMKIVFNACKNKPELHVEDPCLTAINVGTCTVEEGKKAGITDQVFGM